VRPEKKKHLTSIDENLAIGQTRVLEELKIPTKTRFLLEHAFFFFMFFKILLERKWPVVHMMKQESSTGTNERRYHCGVFNLLMFMCKILLNHHHGVIS
jgi:hypothetical protein